MAIKGNVEIAVGVKWVAASYRRPDCISFCAASLGKGKVQSCCTAAIKVVVDSFEPDSMFNS